MKRKIQALIASVRNITQELEKWGIEQREWGQMDRYEFIKGRVDSLHHLVDLAQQLLEERDASFKDSLTSLYSHPDKVSLTFTSKETAKAYVGKHQFDLVWLPKTHHWACYKCTLGMGDRKRLPWMEEDLLDLCEHIRRDYGKKQTR
jgi:hypothetical protein